MIGKGLALTVVSHNLCCDEKKNSLPVLAVHGGLARNKIFVLFADFVSFVRNRDFSQSSQRTRKPQKGFHLHRSGNHPARPEIYFSRQDAKQTQRQQLFAAHLPGLK
jgi:hypothetical protein